MTKRSADAASDLAMWAIFKAVAAIAVVFIPAPGGSAAALGGLGSLCLTAPRGDAGDEEVARVTPCACLC